MESAGDTWGAGFLSWLRRFRDDRSGAIAILFALVLTPVLLSIGIGIDYGRATSYESSMQRVLDETVISGATTLAKTGNAAKAETAARQRFDATKPTTYDIALSVSVDRQSGKVKAKAVANVPMTFMAIAGYKHLQVSADSVAASKRAPPTGKTASKTLSRKRLPKAPKMSDGQIRDLIYRVDQMCYKLRQMNFAHRVPQCKAVFDGTFEKKLRSRIASNGDAKSLLPGGVRLVQ